MENITSLISDWSYGQDTSSNNTVGVVRNPDLGAGILLGYTLLGVATYIWAFWYQRDGLVLLKRSWWMPYSCHQFSSRGVHNIHGPLISVISMDIVNVIAAIILGSQMATSACNLKYTCIYTVLICFISRWFGVIFHLLTAYFSLVYLCNPQQETKIHCTFAIIYLIMCALIPFYTFFIQWAAYMMAIFTFGLVLGIAAKFRVPPELPSAATVKDLIGILAMCTFLVVFLPSFILECLIYSTDNRKVTDEYDAIYVNVLLFTNCHLIMNGLLCCLILKLSAAEEEQQQQWELQLQQ